MRVAVLQLDVSAGEPVAARVDRVLDLVADTARQADVVVLPELWHVGAFDIPAARAHAEPVSGDLVTRLRETARAAGSWLHAGSIAEVTDTGAYYNTSVLIGPDGSLAATYRKLHLFGFDGGEATVMTHGTDLVVAPTPLGLTGLSTCYDLRFPELYRQLTAAGATAFLVPSGWPARRIEHWRVLTRARAIEDQAFVVACNAVGTHAGVPMGGHSVVVDPQGEVVAEAGTDQEVLLVDLDPDRVTAWRSAFPVLADRRL
ncbi:MAG: carbon-nitrogen family hydrolase [Actinomycetota bacterium]|nr:MAG: carbon-nitrogen family hydrolase [Actinomycetota bacterium]